MRSHNQRRDDAPAYPLQAHVRRPQWSCDAVPGARQLADDVACELPDSRSINKSLEAFARDRLPYDQTVGDKGPQGLPPEGVTQNRQ